MTERSSGTNEDTSPDGASSYQLTLEGSGVKIDRPVSEAVARQVIEIVLGGASAPTGGHATPASARDTTGSPARNRRGKSLREFLTEVEASRNLDKIVAIGAYLHEQRSYETFSSSQIKAEFRNAREPVPGNFPRDFRSAVAAGWLAASHDDAKEFYVTDSGQKAIDARFAPDTRKTARSQQPTRRRRSRGSGAEG
jgi:hypothetical protein